MRTTRRNGAPKTVTPHSTEAQHLPQKKIGDAKEAVENAASSSAAF